MKPLEPVHLVFASDAKYYVGILGNLLALLYWGDPQRTYRVFLLCRTIDAATQAAAAQILKSSQHITLEWVIVSEDLEKFISPGYNFSVEATFYRLFIGKYLPLDVTKVIYVDADVLPRMDPGILQDWPLAGKTMGAVWEHLWRFSWHIDGFVKLPEPRDKNRPYFSAGVLIIDLNRWREKNYDRVLADFMRDNPRPFAAQDQTILNIVLADDWVRLPGRFNRQLGFLFDIFSLLPGWRGMLHFTGGFKQWNPMCHFPQLIYWNRLVQGTPVETKERLSFAQKLRRLVRTGKYVFKALSYPWRVRALAQQNLEKFNRLNSSSQSVVLPKNF